MALDVAGSWSGRMPTQALGIIHEMISQGAGGEHVKYLAEFVEKSERGVIK